MLNPPGVPEFGDRFLGTVGFGGVSVVVDVPLVAVFPKRFGSEPAGEGGGVETGVGSCGSEDKLGA